MFFSTAATWSRIPGSPKPWGAPSALPSLQHPPGSQELSHPLLPFKAGKIAVPAFQAGGKGLLAEQNAWKKGHS